MRPTLRPKVSVIGYGRLQGLHLGVPMTPVMDHARYQKYQIVQQLASVLAIEFLYLPTYCPNLSLIEGRWQFLKEMPVFKI